MWELQKPSEAYSHIINLFSFLTQLLFIETNELETKATNLIKVYSDVLTVRKLMSVYYQLNRDVLLNCFNNKTP